MITYVKFFFWAITNQRDFFRLPPLKKSHILYKHKLYKQAGLLYYSIGEYELALTSFYNANSYKNIFLTYNQLGQVSDALEIAEKYGFYREGAQLCMEHSNYVKAAYFYSYVNPLKAAQLYKKTHKIYEAGLCYLKAEDYSKAYICFVSCVNHLHKKQGLLYLEEIAIVLYYQKRYQQAYKIFVELKYFESALLCAYALNHDILIDETTHLITTQFSSDAILLVQPSLEQYDGECVVTAI